jgi:hypothetical protein
VSYDIEMWFWTSESDIRARHIHQWYDADKIPLGLADYGNYTAAQPREWQRLIRPVTAPANAAYVRVATRLYGMAVGASVVIDCVTIRPICPDACPTPGAFRCDGAGGAVETCVVQPGTGCRLWEFVEDCSEDDALCVACDGTAWCEPPCVDECTEGESACVGTSVRECRLGCNGCWQWETTIDCGECDLLCSEATGRAECACPAGTHLFGCGCLPNVVIDRCVLGAPHEIQAAYIERAVQFRGRVWDTAGATAAGTPLDGIQAQWCYALAPVWPVDLEQFECVPAEFDAAASGNDGALGYTADFTFIRPGEYEYAFAFSGDGGASWTTCLTDDARLGFADVVGPKNGDFEEWNEGELMPLAWTAGAGVGVAQETEDVHSGGFALRLTRNVDTPAATEVGSALVPVVPGQTLEIEAQVLDNSEIIRAGLSFRWAGADGVPGGMGGISYSSIQAAWNDPPLRRIVQVPDTARFVQVVFRLYKVSGTGTGASVVVDSVIVRPYFVDLCDHECETPGNTRCSLDDLVIQTCGVDPGTRCRVWQSTVNCADEGDVCREIDGAPACVVECANECHAGARPYCVEDDLWVCLADSDGCYDWGIAEDCAALPGFCEEDDDGARCVLVCDEGFHDGGGVCVPNHVIAECALVEPETLTGQVVGRPVDFYGRVRVEGLTGTGERVPGIEGQWCYAPVTDAPLNPANFVCTSAEYVGPSVEAPGADEYMATAAFQTPGSYHYVFTFSGDGGVEFVPCGLADGELGFAEVIGPPNADFEEWDGGIPAGWSAGNGTEVAQETQRVLRGQYAMRLTRVRNNNAATEVSSALTPVVGGIEYHFDLWLYDIDPDVAAGHIIQWFDAAQEVLATPSYASHTTYPGDLAEWQLYRRTFAAPADAAYVRIATRLYVQSGGQATGGSLVLGAAEIHNAGHLVLVGRYYQEVMLGQLAGRPEISRRDAETQRTRILIVSLCGLAALRETLRLDFEW